MDGYTIDLESIIQEALKRKGLSDKFRRIITGFDQLVHMLTYVVIAWIVT